MEKLIHVTGSDSLYPNLNPAPFQYVRTLFFAIISRATTLKSIPLPLSLVNNLCVYVLCVLLLSASYNITDQMWYIVFSISFFIYIYGYVLISICHDALFMLC